MQQIIDYINKKLEKYSKVVSDMDKKYIWNEIKYTYHGWFDHGYAKWKLTALEDMKDELQALPDGWIPVTERLPENSNDILLRWIFWYVNTAIWRYHHTGENWFVLPNTVGFYKTENVTHWMPLPNSIKQ